MNILDRNSQIKTNLRKKRRLALQESKSVNKVKYQNLNFPRPIKLDIMETFLSEINNVLDINYYGTGIFDIYEEFVQDNRANSQYIEKIQEVINYNIIPSYQDLKGLKSYLTNSKELREDCSCFIDSIDRNIDYDRIIDNDEKINKRFNVDKYLSNSIGESLEEMVNSLCEFIDTYDLSLEAKYNLCLENIPYSFYKNAINVDNEKVCECITDYFLCKESILPDTYIRKMRKVLEKNSLQESNINHYLMNNELQFGKVINSLLETDIMSFKTEKSLSRFIVSKLDQISEMVDVISCDEEGSNKDIKDQLHKTMDGILGIPLAVNVPKSFIESQLMNYASVSKNPYTEEFINNELELQYHSSNGVENLSALHRMNTESENKSYRSIMENALEDNDIQNLLKQFKAEQNKDESSFRKLMNKIYAKKPEEIIDEIPHILGLVRAVFILAPVGVPLIGPILSLVVACVDKLISIHINLKQSEKLLKYIEKEKERVSDKMYDLDDDKSKKAKEYVKSLDSCISKIESYRYSFGDAADRDDSDLDDLNFDLESCVNLGFIPINETTTKLETKEDYSIQELLYYESSLSNIMEKKDILNKIVRNMDSLNESIGYIAKLAVNCPITIDFNSFCESVKDYYFDPVSINGNIEYKLIAAKEEKVELGTVRNVIIESECIDTIETIINEGFDLNNVKLAWKGLKSKIKDLSTKQKSICQSLNAQASTFMNSLEKAIRSDRREAIIKGSIIPSFSRCMKLAIAFGGIAVVNPVAGLITAFGYFACSKALNAREKQLIYDEIETELKVVEKQLQLAENDGDMNQYRFLLNYQKKLYRERQRIRFNLKVNGRPIPSAVPMNKED